MYPQYNYGNPYNQPYGVPNYAQAQFPQQRQQQIMQQPQQQIPYETPIQEVRFVSEEEARAYIVMPNTRALLIDKQRGVAYLKLADSMGTADFKRYRFEEVNEDGTPKKPVEQSAQVDMADFVKKSDLSTFGFVTIEQYNELLERLENIQRQMIGGKQNVNGAKQQQQR